MPGRCGRVRDIASLSGLLGKKPYLSGDKRMRGEASGDLKKTFDFGLKSGESPIVITSSCLFGSIGSKQGKGCGSGDAAAAYECGCFEPSCARR